MNQIAAESINEIVEQVRALRKKSEFAAAIDILEAGTQEAIRDTQQARTIARLFSDLQRPDLAIATLLKGGFAENPHVLADLAVYHELVGDFGQAEALINDCIDLEPDPIEPQLVLARVLEHQGEYERANRLVHNILQHHRIEDPRTAIRALYQLAQCQDKLGNYNQAYEAACQAKEIQKRVPGAQQLSQQGLKMLFWAKQIHVAMQAERLKGWHESSGNLPTSNLVHLIGHPRSGTTLLGHRLERFADVKVASEQNIFLHNTMPQLVGDTSNALANLDELSGQELGGIRGDYFRLMIPFFGESKTNTILIDKKPAHLTFLFALLRLTPKAKFIVALRDPRDVIVSCFMRYFPLSDMSASFLSLGTGSLFYRNFMNNWLLAKNYMDPDSYCEVRYDRLCNDTVSTIRNVGEFIGSQLEEHSTNDLANHQNRQYIHSPTFAEVRKPIRDTQVGRWENYAQHLKPFLQALDPIAKQLGYE